MTQTTSFGSDYAMYRMAGSTRDEAMLQAANDTRKGLIAGFEALGAKFHESGSTLRDGFYCIMTVGTDKFTFYVNDEGSVKYHAFQPWH